VMYIYIFGVQAATCILGGRRKEPDGVVDGKCSFCLGQPSPSPVAVRLLLHRHAVVLLYEISMSGCIRREHDRGGRALGLAYPQAGISAPQGSCRLGRG
jgi:hypothetical protein